MTFMEAVEALRLPRPDLNEKGRNSRKKDISFAPHQRLEKIDLSGFVNKRISRAGMRELIEGMELMPCVRTVCLRNNGITDDLEKEVIDIFRIKGITSIDLSQNKMKKLGGYIGRILKEGDLKLKWLDLTQNYFSEDSNANSLII